VSPRHELERLLRWYPAKWRGRYGDEFLALLEDRLAGAPPTLRFRTRIAAAGVRERAFEASVLGNRASLATQRRTGLLSVLVAWSIMVISGASLTKMAEHSSSAMPVATRSVAQWAYDATAAAGVAGTLMVVVGAMIALPAFARYLRAGGWHRVRRACLQAVAATAVSVLATLGLAAWAHHLNALQRNGADRWYSAAFLVCAVLVVVAIALWTKAAVVTVAKIDLSTRVLGWESWLALGVTTSTVAVVVGTATWWVQMGLYASWFLHGTRAGVPASPWSDRLAVTALLMMIALAMALWGLWRVALTNRRERFGAFVLGGQSEA